MCKRMHSVAAYIEKNPPMASGECPFFAANGHCRFGFKCVFANSHADFSDMENPRLIEKEVKSEPVKMLNVVNADFIKSVRKRQYNFKFYDPQKGDAAFEEVRLGAGEKTRKRVDFANKIYIAPLTTVGNLTFRRVVKEYGADITCCEMATVDTLIKGQKSEWALLKRHPSEDVFGVQLAGSNEHMMGKIAEIIDREFSVDFIDLNMGCPIDVITDRGWGSALMNRTNRVKGIANAIWRGARGMPLGLKMRVGWSRSKYNAHL